MVLAGELVRKRLLKVSSALDEAGLPYAVVGGNAVAAWVATIDVAAVRNTQDVDILLDRSDLPAAIAALENSGFFYRHSASLDTFLEGPDSKARDAVHVVFAGEKVRPDYVLATPTLNQAERMAEFATLGLEALVCMKLTSNRRKDQVHVLDLIGVGLVDEGWLNKLPDPLRPRLQELLDNPEG